MGNFLQLEIHSGFSGLSQCLVVDFKSFIRKLPRKEETMKMANFHRTIYIHNTAMDGWIGVNKIWDHHSIVQGWNKNGAVKTCNDCLRQFPNVNNNYSDPWGGALHTSSTIHGDMNTDIFYT